MTLLEDLLRLGDGAVPSELPAPSQLDRVVSSLVKVLEHEGLLVADELFPVADVATVAAAAAPAASAEATKALEQLVERMERAAAKVTGHPIADDELAELAPGAPFVAPSTIPVAEDTTERVTPPPIGWRPTTDPTP